MDNKPDHLKSEIGGDNMNGPDSGYGMRGRGGMGLGRRGGRGGAGAGMGLRGGRGRGGGPPTENRPRQQEDRVYDRLQSLQGPTHDLAPRETITRKFTNHCRLFVGNIPPDMKQEEFDDLFKKFGETAETFINPEKAFGFVKLDYRSNAEKAKTELDSTVLRGRTLKIRFAAHGAALKVKNLSQHVSNELLEKSFGVFGEVENAICTVDSKGKPTGEGVVEFVAKPAALLALKMCTDGCFFLTTSPRPVIVELLVEQDNTEGHPEKAISKRHPEYLKERETSPRFATPGTFEYEYGSSWKAIYELQRQKLEALEAEIRYEKEKLEERMEYAKYEHETNLLREQLRHREMERERQARESEMRQRHREEQRTREEEMYRSRQEEMQTSLARREEELKRRAQENALFLEANRDYNDGGNYGSGRSYGDSEGGSRGNMPPEWAGQNGAYVPQPGSYYMHHTGYSGSGPM